MNYNGRHYSFLSMTSPLGVAVQLELWGGVTPAFQLQWLYLLRTPGHLFRGYNVDRVNGSVSILVVLNQGPNSATRFAAVQSFTLLHLNRFA